MRREGAFALGHPGGEHRAGFQEFGAHAGPLRARAGEDEDRLPPALRRASAHACRGRLPLGQGGESGEQLGAVLADQDGPLREPGPAERQGAADVEGARFGLGEEVGVEGGGLAP